MAADNQNVDNPRETYCGISNGTAVVDELPDEEDGTFTY